MGGKQSTTATRTRAYSSTEGAVVASHGAGSSGATAGPSTSSGNEHGRTRARSLGNVPPQRLNGHASGIGLPSSRGAHGGAQPDSDSSTPEEVFPLPARFTQTSSLPVHLLAFHSKFCGLFPIIIYTKAALNRYKFFFTKIQPFSGKYFVYRFTVTIFNCIHN